MFCPNMTQDKSFHLSPVLLPPFHPAGRPLDLGPTSISQLTHFTRLRHLDIAHGSNFVPSVLAPLTCLTHLQLGDMDLQKATGGAAAGAGPAQHHVQVCCSVPGLGGKVFDGFDVM